jgi:hypothetical protein
MAFLRTFVCETCKETVTESQGNEIVLKCIKCVDDEKNTDRKYHFKKLDALTMEQRIRNIEEWIYESEIPKIRTLY